MVLNSRASQEIVSDPPRHALLEIAGRDVPRRGLEALQTAQHDEADDGGDAPTSRMSVRPRAGDHPAQVAVHRGAQLADVTVVDQDAVDPVFRVVAAVARLAVAERDHGTQHCRRRLDDAARSALLRRQSVARLTGGRADARSVPAPTGALEYRTTPKRSSSITLSTRGSRPKRCTTCAIRLRSFSIIWCSSAARISSPSASAVPAPARAACRNGAGSRGGRLPRRRAPPRQ